MTKITVMLNDQDMTIVQKPLLASGDKKTVILHADFSTEWDGYTKTGVFYQDESNVCHAVLNSSGECEIPWEAMQTEGTMYFGIFGIKNNTRKTSEVVKYRIQKGAWSVETSTSDPTPNIYTQIMSAIAPLKCYGLGEMGMNNGNIQVDTIAKLNEKKFNGFWAYGNKDVDLIDGVSSKYVKGITLAYSTGATTQIGVCNSSGKIFVRENWDTKGWGAWQPFGDAIGAVPTTRKINGQPLSADFELSASDVGAALAGFGLGLMGFTSGVTTGIECTEPAHVDGRTANGFWAYKSDTTPLVPSDTTGSYSKYVTGITFAYGSGVATQIGFCNYKQPRWIVRSKFTTWGDWEWVNPPMITGEEYRTTERWRDKAVYTKLVSLGKTTSSFEVNVATPGITNLIRAIPNFGGNICDDWDTNSFTEGGAFYFKAMRQTDNIYCNITCGSWRLDVSLSAQFWYTKD